MFLKIEILSAINFGFFYKKNLHLNEPLTLMGFLNHENVSHQTL